MKLLRKWFFGLNEAELRVQMLAQARVQRLHHLSAAEQHAAIAEGMAVTIKRLEAEAQVSNPVVWRNRHNQPTVVEL